MENLTETLVAQLVAQRRKDITGTTVMSVLYIFAIGYFVFAWGKTYPNFSALGIWAMLAFQTLSTFLLFGPSLETKRWAWWKISWLLTLTYWSLGLLLGLTARGLTARMI